MSRIIGKPLDEHKLKELLRERNMSLGRLSGALGRSVNYMTNKLKGSNVFQDFVIRGICEILNISEEDIVLKCGDLEQNVCEEEPKELWSGSNVLGKNDRIAVLDTLHDLRSMIQDLRRDFDLAFGKKIERAKRRY